MNSSLVERFLGFLRLNAPSLIAFVVDAEKNTGGKSSSKSDFDTLRIEVFSSELVFVYGFFHEHFLAPDEPEEDAFLEVIELCQGVISESVVAFYAFDAYGKMINSILSEPAFEVEIPRGGKLKVVSFKGTYNNEIASGQ